MRFISIKPAADRAVATGSVATQAHPLLSRLGRGMLPRWLGGKQRQQYGGRDDDHQCDDPEHDGNEISHVSYMATTARLGKRGN